MRAMHSCIHVPAPILVPVNVTLKRTNGLDCHEEDTLIVLVYIKGGAGIQTICLSARASVGCVARKPQQLPGLR